MKLLLTIMFWGMLTAWLAYRKNFNPVLWFVFGSFLPVIAVFIVVLRKPVNRFA